jgi:hypothetical protein
MPAIGGDHPIRIGMFIAEGERQLISTGEDQDSTHVNDKIVLRAIARVRTDPKHELEGCVRKLAVGFLALSVKFI